MGKKSKTITKRKNDDNEGMFNEREKEKGSGVRGRRGEEDGEGEGKERSSKTVREGEEI